MNSCKWCDRNCRSFWVSARSRFSIASTAGSAPTRSTTLVTWIAWTLSSVPCRQGMLVTGSAYRGVGIPDCVHQAQTDGRDA